MYIPVSVEETSRKSKQREQVALQHAVLVFAIFILRYGQNLMGGGVTYGGKSGR